MLGMDRILLASTNDNAIAFAISDMAFSREVIFQETRVRALPFLGLRPLIALHIYSASAAIWT